MAMTGSEQVVQIVHGSVAGTGATITITAGFKPRYVKVFNRNATPTGTLEHIEGMADASAFLTTASSGVITLDTTAAITLTSRGFTIGNDGVVNVNGDTLFYIAFA
jgi:glutamate 5-kinase